MLQRQNMVNKLQELQRRQQLQDLGNNGNQNYVNQLSSLKQASGDQFPPTVNETPVQDSSRMLILGNMQMMQHGGPNGLVLSQNHNLAPQFDISSYGTHAQNSNENFNQYAHLQGPSNLSINLLTKNQFAFGGSFMSPRSNFSSDQISVPDGPLVFNQDKNFFGHVQDGDFKSGNLSGSYPQQEITIQRNSSFLESGKRDENAASLDPLEQKILYNTDDNSWKSGFSKYSKMSSAGFENTAEMLSLQSGSWSALMQSAVAETSSSDTGIQEEWSGLSYQNPEPANNSEKLQNNWVDRNLQNASSPSSKPGNLLQNMNSFTNFQQSAQYIKPKEEFHTEFSYGAMQHSPRNTSHLVDNKSQQLIQGSLPSANIWPGEHKEQSNNDAHQPTILSYTSDNQPCDNFSGDEFRNTFWLQGSTSDHVSSIQKKYDQVNQLNIHGYSVKSENLASVGVSHGERVTAPSENSLELLNKKGISNDQKPAVQLSSKDLILREFPNTTPVSPNSGFRMGPTNHQTPQSYPFFQSMSMGSSSATSLSSHIVSDYIKNEHSAPPVPSQMATEFPAYSSSVSQGNFEFPSLENVPESQPSLTPDMLQNVGFPMGPPTPWPENQNSFQHEYHQLEKGNSVCEGPTGINNSTPLSISIHEQELVRNHHLEANAVKSGLLITNSSEQPSWQADGRRNDPRYDNVNNQHLIANAKELFLGEQQSGVEDKEKNDSYGSNLTYKSRISVQMAPSWFKHYGTFKNEQMLPMHDARSAINAAQPFAEMTIGKLQENSLIMRLNLAKASQGSVVSPSIAATSIACKQLNSPSDVTQQNLAVSIPKKRKLVAIYMVPWHKEVNHEQSRLHDVSTSEYLWAEASNRRPEEVNNEAEVEELLPVNRAKRRLISSVQHMQQVFRPPPAVILCSDAGPNCDYVAYFAARLALADACLTGQLPSDDNMSSDKLNTSKRLNAYELSKVVEAFINRVKKLEANFSRLEKNLSFVDIKVETRDMEKFSIINRFAKFHFRAHPNTASSSGKPTVHKTNVPQRYVVPHPMPKILPEGIDCLSL